MPLDNSQPMLPKIKPVRPYFGSGPTAKPMGWSLEKLPHHLISRSHRSPEGLAAIQELLLLTREVLKIPPHHSIALVPGSATGAVQMAMWNLLGTRPVSVCTEDLFGKLWYRDIQTHMPFLNVQAHETLPGCVVDFKIIPPEHDLVFLWNHSMNGTKVSGPPLQREGLVICDATSAVYAMDIAWDHLDAIAFSWQKGLGGEAGFGMLVLSPRAVHHLTHVQPIQKIPFLLNLRQDLLKLLEGKTLNTPSMLCLTDALWCHQWALKKGGLTGLKKRSYDNLDILASWVKHRDHPSLSFLAQNVSERSSTTISIQMLPQDQEDPFQRGESQNDRLHKWAFYKKAASFLAKEKVAYDILNHPAASLSASPCFRLWGGPTVEAEDMQKITYWLDFILNTSKDFMT